MKKLLTEKYFDYKTIKTFEDACDRLNISATIPSLHLPHQKHNLSIINYYKLCIIFEAINNGWEPDWADLEQEKFYPGFGIDYSTYGLGFSSDNYDSRYTVMYISSRLCCGYKSKSYYIAQTFTQEYKNFLL